MEIRYIDYGFAYSFGNTIELNRKLKKTPKLMAMLIQHEIEHIKAKSLLQDIIIDLKDILDFKKHRLLREFVKKHDKNAGLQSIKPFWFVNGSLNYNLPLICIYSAFALIGMLIIAIV